MIEFLLIFFGGIASGVIASLFAVWLSVRKMKW